MLTPAAELYTAASDGTFKRWDPRTGLVLETIPVPVGTACAFSADGRYLVGATWDGKVHVVSTERRIEVRSADASGVVTAVAIAEGGSAFAALSLGGTLDTWDLETTERRAHAPLGYDSTSIAMSPDGARVALADTKRVSGPHDGAGPLLVDAITGAVLATGDAGNVEFSPDSRRLFTGSSFGVRDAATGGELHVPADGWAGKVVMSASRDSVAVGRRLVSLESGAPIDDLPCDPVAFDRALVACARGADELADPGPFDFVSLATGRTSSPFAMRTTPPVSGAQFSPDGRWLYLGDPEGHTWGWDLETLSLEREYDGHATDSDGSEGRLFALSPDGASLVTSMGVHDSRSGNTLATLREGGSVFSIAYSTDGARFAALYADGASDGVKQGIAVHSTRLPDDAQVEPPAAPTDEPLPPSTEFALPASTAAHEGLTPLGTLEGHFLRFLFRPGTHQVLALRATDPSSPITLEVLDADSGATLSSRPLPGRFPTAIAAEPNGQSFFSASLDLGVEQLEARAASFALRDRGVIQRTRFDALDDERVFAEHGGTVSALAVSADGERVASGGIDGVVKIWSDEGDEVGRLETRESGVTALAFSPDRTLLAVASRDGATHVYRLSDGNRITLLGWSEWLAFDDHGNFDASAGGSMLAAAVVDGHAMRVEAIAPDFNRPDRVLSEIGLGKRGTLEDLAERARRRNARLARPSARGNAPEVRIESVAVEGKTARLSLSLTDDVGLASYQIRVNGVSLFPAQGVSVGGAAASPVAEIELQQGDNRIEVTAQDVDGAESAPVMRTVVHEGAADRDLYYVGFGVSKYADPTLDTLKFAAKDVSDLGEVLVRAPGFRKVHVLTFTDEQVKPEMFQTVKSFLAPSHADDVVVLFVSGHGEQVEGADPHYYFLPGTADPSNVAATSIALDAFESIFDGLGARNRVLFMDTCEAGEADAEVPAAGPSTGDLVPRSTGRRKRAGAGVPESGPPKAPPGAVGPTFVAERPRMVDGDLRHRSGAVILSSSRGTEDSYEAPSLENGVFTEALLEAFGAAKSAIADDRSVNSVVRGKSIEVLRAYVVKRVEELTGGRQHPTIDRDNADVRFVPLFDREVW
ncbi:MAG: caspase family protein [Polyangiaceae bacterium]